jgi:hypothetical protein
VDGEGEGVGLGGAWSNYAAGGVAVRTPEKQFSRQLKINARLRTIRTDPYAPSSCTKPTLKTLYI